MVTEPGAALSLRLLNSYRGHSNDGGGFLRNTFATAFVSDDSGGGILDVGFDTFLMSIKSTHITFFESIIS